MVICVCSKKKKACSGERQRFDNKSLWAEGFAPVVRTPRRRDHLFLSPLSVSLNLIYITHFLFAIDSWPSQRLHLIGRGQTHFACRETDSSITQSIMSGQPNYTPEEHAAAVRCPFILQSLPLISRPSADTHTRISVGSSKSFPAFSANLTLWIPVLRPTRVRHSRGLRHHRSHRSLLLVQDRLLHPRTRTRVRIFIPRSGRGHPPIFRYRSDQPVLGVPTRGDPGARQDGEVPSAREEGDGDT